MSLNRPRRWYPLLVGGHRHGDKVPLVTREIAHSRTLRIVYTKPLPYYYFHEDELPEPATFETEIYTARQIAFCDAETDLFVWVHSAMTDRLAAEYIWTGLLERAGCLPDPR
jgi:hypothetical protein